MVDYEVRFLASGRYAPHIFDNLCRKFKKFIDSLTDNIRRYVATNDLETFTRALRITHIVEIENDKFMTEQKSAGKKPCSASASTHHQKKKQVQRSRQFRAQPTP